MKTKKDKYWNKLVESEKTFDALTHVLSDYGKQYKIKIKKHDIQSFNFEKDLQKQYSIISIPKKRGGKRTISIPDKKLKDIQRALLYFLSDNFSSHKTAVGFTKGKSIVDNAKLHTNKKYVVCFDIQDFFPSINWGRIFGMLQKYPFNANEKLARIIANLTTYYDMEKQNKILPQGAPTSPYLANMLCRKMDSRIFNFFKDKNVHYSRYADDLTFSTNDPKKVDLIMKKVPHFIKEEGFKLNKKKTRVLPYYKRQIVTGIVVNKKLSLPREYIRGIRALLHNVEKYGWDSQAERNILTFDDDEYFKYLNFQKDIDTAYDKLPKQIFDKYNKRQSVKHLIVHSKNHINLKLKSEKYSAPDMMKMVTKGKIGFLGMVRGKDDKIYKTFSREFDLLKLMEQDIDVKYIKVYKDFEKIINKYKETRLLDKKTISKITYNILELKNLDSNENLFVKVQNKISSILHNPKRTSEILINFHKDDNVLKYTNHDWDKYDDNMTFLSNANYESFIKMLDIKWTGYNKEFYSINKNIGTKIYHFIKFDNPEWSSYQTKDKIEMGWGHPDFIKWIKENPNKKPDQFRLPNQIRKTNGETVSNFKDLRELFNREIRFKDGLYNIFKLIKKSSEAKDFNIKIVDEDKFRKSYEIYTDVYWVIERVKDIITHFQGFIKNSTEIEIALKKPENKLIIEITHIGSYPNSDVNSPSFDEFNEGHLSRFKTKFRGICDWAIESKFEDGEYRLNYLRSDNRDFKENAKSNDIKGFKHILTFYEVTKND